MLNNVYFLHIGILILCGGRLFDVYSMCSYIHAPTSNNSEIIAPLLRKENNENVDTIDRNESDGGANGSLSAHNYATGNITVLTLIYFQLLEFLSC